MIFLLCSLHKFNSLHDSQALWGPVNAILMLITDIASYNLNEETHSWSWEHTSLVKNIENSRFTFYLLLQNCHDTSAETYRTAVITQLNSHIKHKSVLYRVDFIMSNPVKIPTFPGFLPSEHIWAKPEDRYVCLMQSFPNRMPDLSGW